MVDAAVPESFAAAHNEEGTRKAQLPERDISNTQLADVNRTATDSRYAADSTFVYCPEMRVDVVGVHWDSYRLCFLVDAAGAEGVVSCYLVADSVGDVRCLTDVEKGDDGRYLVRVNVTNDGWSECLQPGAYRLVLADGAGRWNEAGLAVQAAGDAMNAARAFPYGNGVFAQIVYLDVVPAIRQANNDSAAPSRKDNLEAVPVKPASATSNALIVTASFAPLNEDDYSTLAGWSKAPRRSEGSNWRRLCWNTLDKVLFTLYRVVHGIHTLSSGRTGIVFLSETSDALRPNMKTVRDRLIERGLDRQFAIRVACHTRSAGGEHAKRLTESVLACALSDVIVVDDYVPLLTRLKLPDDVALIQLWHAGAGIKAVGYSRWGHPHAPMPFSSHRQTTYCICASDGLVPTFAERFGIDEERIIPLGIPRMDALLDEGRLSATRARMLELFPECVGKWVVLFAPTYRGKGRGDAGYPYEMIDFGELYRACGENQVVLFKMHPWVEESVPIPPDYRDRLINVNADANINDLFSIADVLVTDYSSCAFEFAALGKHMVFFAFDEEEYACNRGFQEDYESVVSGRLCKTFPDLVEVLEGLAGKRCPSIRSATHPVLNESAKTDANCPANRGFFSLSGGAADRVIDWLVLGKLPAAYADALRDRIDYLARVRQMRFTKSGENQVHAHTENEIAVQSREA